MTGADCVSIEWRSKDDNAMNVENWCRALYLVNGTYYLAPVELTTTGQRQGHGAVHELKRARKAG